MNVESNIAAAERALEKQGGFYTLDDIVGLVRNGYMQSFHKGNSWVVTRIAQYPRKTAMEIVFMMGNEAELKEIEAEVIEFARDHDVTTGYAYGRPGYLHKAFDGWKMVSALFIKDFAHG